MQFNKIKYLERIGLTNEDVISKDISSLRKLHYNHLLNVPFENLDIHWGNKIKLDIDELYKKIVINKRGGFCYELNGLFYALLKELGYNVKMISARVFNTNENTLGEEFDHMALLVSLEDKEYLCDVGFGNNTAEPLEYKLNEIQEDREGKFIIERYDTEYMIVKRIKDNIKENLYLFTEKKRMLKDYNEMCYYHQTSGESHFTRNKVCSQLTMDGMKTISGNKLILKSNGSRIEKSLNNEKEFEQYLFEYFKISKYNSENIILQTERLILDKYTNIDAESLISLVTDTDVMKYYPKPLSRNEAVDFLNRVLKEYNENKPSFWKVILKENNEYAGQAGVLYRKVEDEWVYMLGYMTMKKYWGKGIAAEISRGILEYCDNNLHLPNIITLIRPENLQSVRVAEKLGLKYKKQVEYFGFVHNYYER